MRIDKQIARIKKKLESRKKLDPDTGCWLYDGNIESNGYGRIYFLSRAISIHRLSAYLYLGLSLNDLWYSDIYILHKDICPNRHCFNPEHLYIGTQKDNMDDRAAKLKDLPCGHIKSNLYIYTSKDGKTYKWCRTCRSNKRYNYWLRNKK